MKRASSAVLAAAAALALGLVGAGAHAQTLRWSSQGDLQTMDPDSRNESLTNSLNGQVYETLTGRDKELGIVPMLAVSWQQTGPIQSPCWTNRTGHGSRTWSRSGMAG